MELQELKQTDWYKERPKIIKDAIDILPPTKIYKFKDSGKQCLLVSFEEPESGNLEDVTCTVYKTGNGGAMELGVLDTNQVFGVKIDDLEKWED